MSANNDGSESVDHFLARIAGTPQGRDEATRRMDEEFLKGRQERQARRLERARSISPSKTGPTKNSSLSLDTPSTAERALNPPVDFSPQSQNLSRSNALSGRTSLTRESDSSFPRPSASPTRSDSVSSSQQTATGLARSGTLSWQQRPTSRDSPRQRPLSGLATVRSLPQPPVEADEKEEPSRKDIAASLAQKDPTWFRQTQDRGLSSAAYRKNQVDDTPEGLTFKSMQLPGMSRSREPSKSPVPEERPVQQDRLSEFGQKDLDRLKRGNTPDIVALRSSMIEKPSPVRHSRQDSTATRPLSIDSSNVEESVPDLTRSSSILSQNRPVSPTKGLGGFVESAMMRRSDSVSKRWSVKADTGLKRGDSVAGGRPPSLHSRGMSRNIQSTRSDTPSSPLASSRPSSSHNNESAVSPFLANSPSQETQDIPVESSKKTSPVPEPVEPPADRPQTPSHDAELARSPSKTMDPRRWSPTKSTWLGSALQQKNEPPKLQPMKEEQPRWKVDLQRSKSQRASRDVSPDKRPLSQDSSTKFTPAVRSPANKSQLASTTAATALLPSKQEASLPTSVKTFSKEESTKSIGAPEARLVQPGADQAKEEPKTEPEHSEKNSPVSQTETSEKPPAMKLEDKSVKSEEPSRPIVPEISKKPPVLKPKPQTPPKTDFRTTLRSRAQGPDQNTGAEPEFKSMFGKLKRTTTQNYVAPDELKHNILSGKAALNLTDGPVKTKRVDEFKESILAKKEDMKAAPQKFQQVHESNNGPDAPIPEALARRKTLSKANVPSLTNSKPQSTDEAPKDGQKPQVAPKTLGFNKTEPVTRMSGKAVPSRSSDATLPSTKPPTEFTTPSKGPTSQSTKPSVQPPKPAPTAISKAVEDIPSSRATAVIVPMPSTTSTSRSVGVDKPIQSPEIPPASPADVPSASRLASRLNPSLAAMLSRGPSPLPQASPNASADSLAYTPNTAAVKKDDNEDAGSLTHMTKGRAKAPKRRAPKVEQAPTVTSTLPIDVESAASSTSNTIQKAVAPTPTTPPAVSTPKTVEPGATKPKPVRSWAPSVQKSATPASAPLQELKQPRTLPTSTDISEKLSKNESGTLQSDVSSDTPKTKPAVASKSPELRKVSSPVSIEEKLKSSTQPPTPRKPSWSPAVKQSLPTIGTATPSKSTTLPTSEPSKDVKIPTRSTTVDAQMNDKDTKPPSSPARSGTIQGLGLKMSPSPRASKHTPTPRVLTPPPENHFGKGSSHNPHEIRALLEGYVGLLLKVHDKADFDVQQFLGSAKVTEDKCKTLQFTIHEITGDGKKKAMPQQQEHILYEESMYLITHKFLTEAGATLSEVYLWHGDRVADSSIEDAQLFGRRDAREHNAKLEVVKQGKETSKQIQALGGILITRRSKTSALYMLCGRRHLGHIVFDEVDMEASSLCPGFAYLISASFGKLYLWKGKGASVDEISSAKLIGMDLGLTGEIEEINQGSEPSSFWSALGSKAKNVWSDDWHQRGNMNGYPTVIYRVEHERPGMLTNLASWGLKRAASPAKQQIKATCERLHPYTQNDLDAPAVHIVDAYRMLYIVLTRQCASKASEFVTALYLAQDFAMLSPAIQDRPILPTCYVIAGEMTNDVKACFRKWSVLEGKSLAGSESICVRLEEVMEALNL